MTQGTAERATKSVDVVIVGAGMAGASAAAALGRAGYDVLLADPHASCPPWFKAEKVEPEHTPLLRELGLMDAVLTHAQRIGRVKEASHGLVLHVSQMEQYGIAYRELVNSVRAAIPPSVDVRTDRVLDIDASETTQHVRLADGGVVDARLVVLATGTAGKLHERLGITHTMLSEGHSLAVGFDVEPADRPAFSFESLTYFPTNRAARTAYLTIFPMEDRMRANLFLYRAAKDPWVRAVIRDPVGELLRLLPGLARVTGAFKATSKVEVCPIDLYRSEGHRRPGVALVGDAFQSVDPITGTGLSKLLTDVAVLASRIPQWLATPGMGVEKINSLYDDPRKQAEDERSLSSAMYHRKVSEAAPLRWQAHHWRWVAAAGMAHVVTACQEWVQWAESLLR